MATLSSNQIRAERAAQETLFQWLRVDQSRIRHFVRALPDSVASWFDEWKGAIQLSQNEMTSSGGFMDLVFRGGPRALVLEIKIKHRENSFQYYHYRGFLEQQGFEAKAVGLLGNKIPAGRLVDAVLALAADARISWGGLLKRLKDSRFSPIAVGELIESLEKTYPEIASGTWVGRPSQPVPRVMSSLEGSPETLAVMIKDIIERLPSTCVAFPDQAGNSPPLLRIGEPSWAKWFGDEDGARVVLNFDIPRPSKQLTELHFEFNIQLFLKTYARLGKRPLRADRLQYAASVLNAQGCLLERNMPGKHSPSIPWAKPFAVEPSGLNWICAWDRHNYRESLTAATKRGWEGTVANLLAQYARLSTIMDRIVDSERRGRE